MLSRRIRMLRKNMGISQAQLGEILNVSTSAIGMYEQGRREPGINMLIQMATTFHVSLDYLITGGECENVNENHPELTERELCPCSTCYWKGYK